ncbi:hypothetical protein [Sphingobium sp.]|uniref:hypothetical protein n=1 Tax=Sphingobium sp. TaxID=1912891 RepID=UPI003BB61A60
MTRACLFAAACMTLALAGCGGRESLKPLPNQALPALPTGAKTAPTAAQLMSPSMQARPQRNVELLTQSQERADDTFDLPPEHKPQ